MKFFERVVELHPDAPRPFAIGNCQAGYQTLMVAMLRPDLFGPCLVAGSPMSYWQGVHGKNPMRYSGGLLGGSWLTAMTSDLGNGKFDGTWLVLNFDSLGPANWLWGKQYEVYTNIDTGAERYLEFEKWWGDFIQLNGDELQFLVDNLFIGDKLTRNQLQSHDGTTFDVRNITSPIIVFTSTGDNISPPPQALGWILDLYRDVDDIRATGQTIVYCLDHKIGHLAIFVSTKVGAEQDEEFVQMMDVIDCLPPGLHEMVISPRPADMPAGGFVTGDWIARFETALARRHPRARAQQPRGRPRLRRRGPRVGTQPRRSTAPSCSPWCARWPTSRRRIWPSPESAPAQLHDLRRQQPLDEGRAEAGCRRGGGAQAGGGRQPVPRAADAGLRPDHRGLGCLSRRARPDGRADVLRLLWLAVRAGASRHRCEQRGAAGPRHLARTAGGTTGPGGGVRGEAADRRVRRSADPGGAVRHRRPTGCSTSAVRSR